MEDLLTIVGRLNRIFLTILSIPVTLHAQFTDINVQIVGVGDGVVAWCDYDSDSDLDILVSGRTIDQQIVTKIFRNDGNGLFLDIGAELLGITFGSIEWGDYDNDGDPDILLIGDLATSSRPDPITRIYRNMGSDIFEEVLTKVIDVSFGNARWGDFDNDGDLDIILSGIAGQDPVTRLYENTPNGFEWANQNFEDLNRSTLLSIDYDNNATLDFIVLGDRGFQDHVALLYKNDGYGNFSTVFINLPGSTFGSLDKGDFDNDGDLDLLLTGLLVIRNAAMAFGDVYRNDGNAIFTNIEANIKEVFASTGSWGDFDNDGDLDILISGEVRTAEDFTTRLYRNNNDGTFTDIQAGLVNLGGAASAWGDYDNDGDLDIVLTGRTKTSHFTKIYRNDFAIQNTAPVPPDGLTSIVKFDTITITWQRATDLETPAPGLTYNVRLGKTPTGNEVISSHSDASGGHRLVPQIGNVQANTHWQIHGLEGGQYYWSVQSIDGAFASSEFAINQSFIVPPMAPPLVSPENQSTGVSIKPFLTWNTSIGTNSYRIQISQAIDFETPIYDSTLIDTTFVPEALEYFTVYYWRVNASNVGGTSRWSDSWEFTTKLQAPILESPEDNSDMVPLNAIFVWQPVSAAESYGLQLSRDTGFQKNVIEQTGLIDIVFVSSQLESHAFHYWRVNASNVGGPSDWSTVWRFRTILSAPRLVSPADNTAVNEDSVVLLWNSVIDSATYHLQLATDVIFENLPIDRTAITDTSFMFAEISDSTTYYWRVRALHDEELSEWSSIRKFSTNLITSINVDSDLSAIEFMLFQNYPNPFNPSTEILYTLSTTSQVHLTVYNQLGQQVRKLVHERREGGVYRVRWDGRDSNGNRLASGVYLLRLKAGSFIQMRKMLLIR